MIPPSLDFTSDLFDPHKALYSKKVPLPYPKAKTFNNIAQYYSHTFLKKGFESNKLKKEENPRERNYDWYYDTLGLSEYQRNVIRCTKKIKKRKGKKPVSVVTIPCSPLKSEKVTVCKSDFKDYWRRKYRLFNTASAAVDMKFNEFEAFSSNRTSESSFTSSVFKSESSANASVLAILKPAAEKSLPTSSDSTEIKCPSSLFCITKSELATASHMIKPELPSVSCVMETVPYDSSDDSYSDDILIRKMKFNVLKGYTLKTVYESSKCKYVHVDSKCVKDTHQKASDKKLSMISKPACFNSSDDFSLYAYSNKKSSCALSKSDIETSSQMKDSSNILVNNQNKGSKKHKVRDESDSLGDKKTLKPEKRLKHGKSRDDYSNLLDCDKAQKSVTQDIPSLKKKIVQCKENSSVNDSKSNMPIKKSRKSALKSQVNVLNCKKLSTANKVVNKSSNISKIKTKNSSMVNHCTCKFPCELSHLCSCGYYANAKEALSKFKIPRIKK